MDRAGAPPSSGRARLALAVLAAAAVYVALALADVAPGGWRLRSLISDPAASARDEHRAARLEAFAEAPSPRSGGVLFMGSSTVESFDLDRWFPGIDAVNRGIGDEPLALMRDRLGATLDATRPALVVLYAASADVRRPTADGGAAFRPIGELEEALQGALEDTLAHPAVERVLLVGVLPERAPRPPVEDRVRAFHAAQERLAEALGPRVGFVPTHRPPLVLEAGGWLDPASSRDTIHLGDAGYGALAVWLRDAAPEHLGTEGHKATDSGG